MIRIKLSPMDVHEAIADAIERTLPIMKAMAEDAGKETFDYLRSYTNEMRPGVIESGGQPRAAHPGGWADRSFVLMNSYILDLVALGRRGWEVQLGITGPASVYAPGLEGRLRADDGTPYSVLEFVMTRGGMYEEALVRAAMNYGLELATR